MGNSRRSSPAAKGRALIAAVDRELQQTARPGDRVLVGLSGGLDSVVLLDILERLAPRRRVQLSALHVNHQLSPNAHAWEGFCRRLCRDRSIPFRSQRVRIARGNSMEAAARSARYAALLSQRVQHIALAHHLDDQAETVLLQLLRGAGVRGLAAMPIRREALGGMRRAEGGTQKRAGGRREEEGGEKKAEGPNSKAEAEGTVVRPSILRPLLDTPRSEIERYARARGLSWVEDESNEDTAYARNFLRHELLPVLERRFPAYRATLARSARHLGEVAQLLDELAAVDAVGAAGAGTITAQVLKQLSPARASNLLRWFLRERGVAAPATEHLGEMLRQVAAAKEGARLRLRLEEHDLYRWRGVLHLVRRCPPGVFSRRKWRAEGRIELPELGGVLRMDRKRGVGISLERLEGRGLSVGVRRGGERLQPDCGRPRRTLKNLLQEHGVPPWERERLPLLYCGDELIWAPHIGVDCAYQARRGERSVNPVWQPRSFA